MAKLPVSSRIRVPPVPQFIVIIDRDDETEWVLAHDTDEEGVVRIAINDQGLTRPAPLKPRTDAVVYGPYDGPYINTHPRARLFVRGGRLGYEYPELLQGVSDRDNSLVLSRVDVRREHHLLLVPSTWKQDGDTLGFNEENFLD